MATKPKAKRETQLIQEAGRRARDLADRTPAKKNADRNDDPPPAA